MAFLNPVTHSLESFLLPLLPFAHNDRSRFKDSLGISMILSRFPLLVRHLPGLAPTEVVEVPEGVQWQNKLPDRY